MIKSLRGYILPSEWVSALHSCANEIKITMASSYRRNVFSLTVAAFVQCSVLQPQPSSAEIGVLNHSGEKYSAAKSLNVAYIQQEKLLGVPTSASMIMAFYGDVRSPRMLKTMSRGSNYIASEPFNDFTITLYKDIVKAAANLGYNWTEKKFSNTQLGFQQGLATIKWEVEHSRPVMIDVSAPDGHTVVVVGFDDATQSVLVVDANVPAPGRYAISYNRLQLIWNEHAFNQNFRSLVITSPPPYTS